jgi:putative DNA primase/helicase
MSEDIKPASSNAIEKTNPIEAILHEELFKSLLKQIEKIDFKKLAGKNDNDRIAQKYYLVNCIEAIIEVALKNNWGLCQNNNKIYVFNGSYWSFVTDDECQTFLGQAAEKLGVETVDARLYKFRQELLKQFISAANLKKPDANKRNILINLQNGTYEFDVKKPFLRDPDSKDFLCHQLPFKYDPTANCDLFQKYLDLVLPDKVSQKNLAEYLAYIFLPNKDYKLEKVLLLYGTGANGKSVFFDVVNALLGFENTCSFSLETLTGERGCAHRAILGDKLVNYASEISGKIGMTLFKQMASGEPIEAKYLYHDPFILTNYAKLMFNCNDLPKDVEANHAYLRRLMIICFNVTIPDNEQDKKLAQKIIMNELSGVFNWVLEGMQRLITNGDFTENELAELAVEEYKLESDSVLMFLNEFEYCPSIKSFQYLKNLYLEYVANCSETGIKELSLRVFSTRLKKLKYKSERKQAGYIVYIEKKVV